MFNGNVMHLPGQEIRNFTVMKPQTRDTERAQILTSGYLEAGKIEAILSQAKPEEIERWKQLGHPISHKIIMKGQPGIEIRPGYALEYAGRRFYVQALPYDIGDLGHWTIFYCDERNDVT